MFKELPKELDSNNLWRLQGNELFDLWNVEGLNQTFITKLT